MGRSFEPSPIENFFFFFFFFLWLFMEGLCYHCYVMGSWAFYIPCKIRPILLECSSGSVSTAKIDIDRPLVHRLVPFSLPFHLVLNTSDSFKIKFSQAPGIGTRRVQQMGASESLLARQSPIQQSRFVDEITTVSERTEGVDPLVERIRALKIATPLLKSSQSESSLTDILLKKPSSGSGTLNPDVLLELFSIYREWQEKKSKEISQKQEELENKIETVDALAAKLLQRFTYSVSAMRSTSQSLAEVYPLQVEVGELKGRLNEVISNCDALCKRISALGPEALGTTITPFSPSIAREKEDSKLQENKPEISKSDV